MGPQNQASTRAVITKPREGSGNQSHPRARPETTGLGLAGGLGVLLTALPSRWGPARAQPLAVPAEPLRVSRPAQPSSSAALGCTWRWPPAPNLRPGLRAAPCACTSRAPGGGARDVGVSSGARCLCEWTPHPRLLGGGGPCWQKAGLQSSSWDREGSRSRGSWNLQTRGEDVLGQAPVTSTATGWLEEQKFTFSPLWRREIPDHGAHQWFLVGAPSWWPFSLWPPVLERETQRDRDLASLLTRTPILSGRGRTFMTSHNFRFLHESPVSEHSHVGGSVLGVRL